MEVHTDVVAWGESLELEFEGMDLPTQSKEVDSDGQGGEIVVGDISIALQAVNTSEENVKVSDREGMHLPGPSSGENLKVSDREGMHLKGPSSGENVKVSDREGMHLPGASSVEGELQCSGVELKLKEDLKHWLEAGPLEGSINTGKFLGSQMRNYLMLPGTTAKLARQGTWLHWLKITKILEDVCSERCHGECFVALAFEEKWRLEDNKDALFEMFNPGFTRDSENGEDVRYSRRVWVRIRKFSIPFEYIQNWRESRRVKDTRIIGVPRNAENILYGRLEGKGTEDCRDGMYRSRQVSPRGGMNRTQNTAYKGDNSGQRREGQRGLVNRDEMCRDLPAITRGGMHRTQGQRSHGGGLSVQIGPLERRVVLCATGPESRDGMHRTLSQATGTVETTYPIKSEDVSMTKVLGGSGSERGDGMHRALPLAARKVEADKKKREHERDTRERMRKGMLKE